VKASTPSTAQRSIAPVAKAAPTAASATSDARTSERAPDKKRSAVPPKTAAPEEERVMPSPGKARRPPARSRPADELRPEAAREPEDRDAEDRALREELRAVLGASAKEKTPPLRLPEHVPPGPRPSIIVDRPLDGGEPGRRPGPERKRRFFKKKESDPEKPIMAAPEERPPHRTAPVGRAAQGGQRTARTDMNPYRVRATDAASRGGAQPASGGADAAGKALTCRSCGQPSQWGMCETCGEAFGELRELSSTLGADGIA
jgi:hypothetical protein